MTLLLYARRKEWALERVEVDIQHEQVHATMQRGLKRMADWLSGPRSSWCCMAIWMTHKSNGFRIFRRDAL
jgi:hypothetical protein